MLKGKKVLWVIFGLLCVGLIVSVIFLVQKLLTHHSNWWDWFVPMLLVYTMVNEWRVLRK